MKQIRILFILQLLLAVACTNDDDIALPQQGDADGGFVTCRLMLDSKVAGYSGETRSADEHEWTDGDRLYIRFANKNDTVFGVATYTASNAGWSVNCSGTLPKSVMSNCEVYYFKNARHKSSTEVELTVHSAVYADSAAKYNFSNNIVAIKTCLMPKTGRVRFVSEEKSDFSLAGIMYYIGFDLRSRQFDKNYKRRLVLNADTLQGSKYTTSYVYGFYENPNACSLDILNHKDSTRIFNKRYPAEMLEPGVSGTVSVPSFSNNIGWSVHDFNDGKYFAKDIYAGPFAFKEYGVYMNGGLLWNAYNDAELAWGSDEVYESGRCYTGTGSISATEYDYFYQKWGKEHRIATLNEACRLMSNNRYFFSSGGCSYLVSGDFNVLPIVSLGYMGADGVVVNDDEHGYFWTADAATSLNAYAAVFSDKGIAAISVPKSHLMGALVVNDVSLRTNDNGFSDVVLDDIYGQRYVDLGLPSGLKWAAYNVGARTPEEYGDYYAWGETETKSDYSQSTSTTSGKEMDDISGSTQYDAARKQWGGSWRLPTAVEFQELIDNCTWEWSSNGATKGYKVTSKVNAQSIFLPAAGWCVGASRRSAGSYGFYCSSTPSKDDLANSYGLYLNSNSYYNGENCRYYGCSVRPVSDAAE